MKKILLLVILLLVVISVTNVFAIWRHPEIAERNSVFIDIGMPLYIREPEFNFLPLDIRITYMLPAIAPLSFGVFAVTPDPNIRFFGVRAGYHFDLGNPGLDVYFLYSFNFGWILNDILIYLNDDPVPVNLFDFRVGFRYFFNGWLGINAELDFNFTRLLLSIAVKLN